MGNAERSEVVLWAEIEFGLLALIFLAVLMNPFLTGCRLVVRRKEDIRVFTLLLAWLGVVSAGAFVGLVEHHKMNYVFGDCYRFGSLAVVMALFYFSLRTQVGFEKTLRGFVLVYSAFLTIDLIRGWHWISEDIRPTTQTVFYAGVIAPLVIYLILFEKKRLFRVLAGLLLLEMLGMLIMAQMFTPFIALAVSLALFLLLSRKGSLMVPLALVLGSLLVAAFYTDAALNAIPNYLASKIRLSMGATTRIESLEALSGARLGESLFVVRDMTSRPLTVPLGAGLGSMISPEPIGDILQLPPAIQYKHYLHSGLVDILYRSGLVGLAIFLLLLARLFRRGYRLSTQGCPFGLLVMVAILNTLLLLSFSSDLEMHSPLLSVCFGGLGVLERGPLREGKKPAAMERSRPVRGNIEATPGELNGR